MCPLYSWTGLGLYQRTTRRYGSIDDGLRLTVAPRALPSWIWALVVVQLPFMFVASTPIVAPDLWWTLRLGELVAASGSVAQSAALSYTPLAPDQVNPQWLAQILYYAAYRLAGLERVVFLTAVAVAATFALLFQACRSAGASAPAAALGPVLGVALVASAAAMGANPSGFGLLGYVRSLLANPIIRLYITAWAPTTVGGLTGLLYFGTALVFVLVGACSRRRMTATETLLALVF